ncbi:hypothetical protein GCM10025873_14320 [Demequina sediminis]|uniref:hypothetical protein n=1 Tax=Demequina sediminis TaxID=1930058 RepID=UPI002573AA8E|nr:hypothetical protein [Demequina sediminis]BDZ61641.1 hypothetical protein GCM10025873_14320 [Demequina sediminis]
MTVTPGYRLVSLESSRAEDMLDVSMWAFVGEIKPTDLDEYRAELPFGRLRAMEIDDPAVGNVGTLAGVAGAFTFRMRVPGGGWCRWRASRGSACTAVTAGAACCAP